MGRNHGTETRTKTEDLGERGKSRSWWGVSEVQGSAGVRVQLERLSQPTRVISVASPQGSSWVVCVCMNECVCLCVCIQ